MSFLIHFIFSPIASIIFSPYLMNLHFMDTFKITFNCILLHGRAHDVWWISFSSKNISHISCSIEFMVGYIMSDEFPFRQKTFLTFTALRVHGTPHDVWWISFSSKKISHIDCTSSSYYSPWCFITFLLLFTRFSHILHLCVHLELHRSQLPFRPRTSTCFRQC